jgi:glycogen debranching enzyme
MTRGGEAALQIAQASLFENIVETRDGPVLRAGGNQFSGLWVRDFCYSIPGLLAAGRSDVVKHQLALIISARRPTDHLVPRLLDTVSSKVRVLRGLFPWLGRLPKLEAPFQAEYVGEHGTEAIDSNLLVLRGLILYVEHTSDTDFDFSLPQIFNDLWSTYASKRVDGWIVQEPYGDWQDSVRRTGATFLTNYHAWWVEAHATRLGWITRDRQELDLFRDRLKREFYLPEQGLYRSHLDLDVVSLDGNALALLEPGFWSDRAEREVVHRALVQSPLGREPGRASFPEYPRSWRSANVRLVGLSHYHDRLAWSWLLGLQGSAALAVGDLAEADRIRQLVESILIRDRVVGEVYRPWRSYTGFKSLLYRSETPFSWGAAFLVDFLARAHTPLRS